MLTHGKIDVTKSKLIFLRLKQVPIELINMAKLPKSKATSRLFSYKSVCGKALIFYLWAAAIAGVTYPSPIYPVIILFGAISLPFSSW